MCEPGMVPEAGHHAQPPGCVPEPAPLPAECVHLFLVMHGGGHRRQTAEGERVVYGGGVGEVGRVAVGVCHCGGLVRGGGGGGTYGERGHSVGGVESSPSPGGRPSCLVPLALVQCYRTCCVAGGKGKDNVEREREMTYRVGPSGGRPRLISQRLLPHYIPLNPSCPRPLPLPLPPPLPLQ